MHLKDWPEWHKICNSKNLPIFPGTMSNWAVASCTKTGLVDSSWNKKYCLVFICDEWQQLTQFRVQIHDWWPYVATHPTIFLRSYYCKRIVSRIHRNSYFALSQCVHLCNRIKFVPLSPEYLVICDGSTLVLIIIWATCQFEMRET